MPAPPGTRGANLTGYAVCGPHPMGGVGNTLIRGCTSLGIGVSRRPCGHPERLARQPAALHLPRFLHPGLQSRRKGQHADHPCAGRAGKWRRDPRSLHGFAHSSRYEGHQSRHRGQFSISITRARSMLSEGEVRSSSPATPSRRRGCCLNSACDGLRKRARQLRAVRSASYLMAQARQRDPGPLRRAGAHVQGAARPRAHRGVLRDRPEARLRARLRHPDGRPAAHRLRQADDGRAREAGAGACAAS